MVKLNKTDIIKLTRYSLEMALMCKTDYSDKDLQSTPVVFVTKTGEVMPVQLGYESDRLNLIMLDQIDNMKNEQSLNLLEKNIKNFKECGLINEKQANLMRACASTKTDVQEASC